MSRVDAHRKLLTSVSDFTDDIPISFLLVRHYDCDNHFGERRKAAFCKLTHGLCSFPAPYVKQCHKGDPKIVDCITGALHHLRPYLAQGTSSKQRVMPFIARKVLSRVFTCLDRVPGIPEIEMPSVEPFRMDELSLSLTTGPNGYKVTLRDLDIYGASNFSVSDLK